MSLLNSFNNYDKEIMPFPLVKLLLALDVWHFGGKKVIWMKSPYLEDGWLKHVLHEHFFSLIRWNQGNSKNWSRFWSTSFAHFRDFPWFSSWVEQGSLDSDYHVWGVSNSRYLWWNWGISWPLLRPAALSESTLPPMAGCRVAEAWRNEKRVQDATFFSDTKEFYNMAPQKLRSNAFERVHIGM